MAKENVFEGFEAMSDLFIKKPGGADVDDDFEDVDPEEIVKINEDDDEDPFVEPPKPSKKPKVEEDDDDSDDDEPLPDEEEDTDDDTDDKDGDEPADLSEFESDITSYLKKRLSDEIGIPIEDDIEDMAGLVKYLDEVVTEASKPKYASSEIEALNKFVQEGGKLEDFYKTGKTDIDVDEFDISSESNQKAAIKERLIMQGYSEDRARKTVARYEDAGVLEEEAEDSVEFLKEYKEKNRKKLLEDTSKRQEQVKKEQQMFVENVEKIVDNTDSIRGIKISSNEKKELLDYIFKPGPDGMTQYQKDYGSDVKNLIESAYFTKQGDVLIERAKKQASSDAHKELHKKIKASKDKRQKGSRSGGFGSGDHAGLSSLSKALLNK